MRKGCRRIGGNKYKRPAEQRMRSFVEEKLTSGTRGQDDDRMEGLNNVMAKVLCMK